MHQFRPIAICANSIKYFKFILNKLSFSLVKQHPQHNTAARQTQSIDRFSRECKEGQGEADDDARDKREAIVRLSLSRNSI